MSSERLLLEEKSPWWGEHLHRYLEVLKYLKGSEKILDIACGTGYGSDLLAEKCNQVIGGDIDKDQIDNNAKYWKRPNLIFQKMDGTKLPFEDESFDVLVSFETIEHTTEYKKMIMEFKRVVKKNGLIFISTPNFYLNSPNGIIVNKFHTQEFTPNQFVNLISQFFESYKIYGQLNIRYFNSIGLRYKVAEIVEKIFYCKGFRKTPLQFQDTIMDFLISKPQYPLYSDYILTENKENIKTKCVTQVAIIKKIPTSINQ